MECSECEGRLNNRYYMCACYGIPLCSSCLIFHSGDIHYIYRYHDSPSPQKFNLEIFDEFVEDLNKDLADIRQGLLQSNHQKLWIDFEKTKKKLEKILQFTKKKLIKETEKIDQVPIKIPIYHGKSFWIFDPVNFKLHQVDFPEINLYNFSVVTYNSELYVVGGCDSLGTASNLIISNQSERQKTYFTIPRYFSACITFQNYLIVIGGYGHDDSLSSIEIIDMQTWENLHVINFKRFQIVFEMPIATIFETNLVITYIEMSQKDMRETIQEKIIVLDLPGLIENQIRIISTEDCEFGTFCFEQGQSAIFEYNNYSWTNTNFTISKEKLYLFRFKDQKLIEYDIKTKDFETYSLEF